MTLHQVRLIFTITVRTHYPSNGMGNEISTVPLGMPADIADMVGYMKGIYDIQDAADGNQDGDVTDMATLKNLLMVHP